LAFVRLILLLAGGAAFGQTATQPHVMPAEFLRSWDPVTLVFNEDLGPAGGGPADDPGALFVLDPRQAGEYRWVDRRTLQFLPAEAWAPLSRITVTTRGLSRALYTLMSPPESVSPPNGRANLDPVQRVDLTLPSWVDPSRLAAMIEIEARPLPGLEGQEVIRLDQADFTIRVRDPQAGTSRTQVVVELAEPIGYGTEITFAIRLAEGATTDAHVARYRFSTRPLFRLADMGSGSWRLPVSAGGSVYTLDQALGIRDPNAPLYLQFSEPLGHLSLEEVRRLVQFSPSVRNFSYEVTNTRLYLRLDADAETPYELRINHQPILSSAGRVLAPFARSGFSFYFEQQQPYLRWERGDAAVELGGPQILPMEGRGVGRVDLRVHKVDPLDRQFWPFGSAALSVNEESRPPMPGDPVDTRERAVRALGSPDISTIVTLPIDGSSPSTDFGLDLAPFFARISGERTPGTYLVGYRALGSEPQRHYVRVVVTDLDLSVVEEEHAVAFVVTSLATGAPIGGARVIVEGQDRNDGPYAIVVQGTTDTGGRYRYDHRERVTGTIRRLRVEYGNDVLVFDPSSPPPAFSNNHWHGSSARWLSWINQDPVTTRETGGIRGYLLTERPIYRPEEPVHILGYVRNRTMGAISQDARTVERRLEISGPGDRNWTLGVVPDAYGQFSADFHEPDVPTGRYTANLVDGGIFKTLATTEFQIEAYRIPRFEVQIHGPERVPVDEPFDLDLVAEYYAGGRVIGRPVLWRVTESAYGREAVGYPGFSFSSYESIGGAGIARSSGVTRQNSTDETGLAVLRIDPRTRQSASAVGYVVEGTVEGADGQSVTAVKAVVALPPFSVGVRQERFVRDGMVLKPQVVALSFDGNPLAGIVLGIRLYQRQWHSYLVESDFVTGEAEYRSDVVDELVLSETRTSQAGIVDLSYPVKESGVYVLEIQARDNVGRLQSVRVDTYVPGTTPVAWERTEGNVFRTTADKEAYRPGDTARILLQSPFQTAAALAVVEGPAQVSYEWVEIRGGQAVFDVPITERMVPRLPVHFLLMRGRVPGTESRYTPAFDRGRPVSVANTTFLDVLPVRHELSLKLTYPDTNLPGATIPVEIELEDASGAPVNGQVALWLVDRAVLSLAQEKPIRPLDAFIDPVHSAITIRDARNQVVGNLPFRENPGGGGFEGAEEERLLDRTTVRRNVQTVPYYNPRIAVTNGRATVRIALPDNLTDFAVRAIAVSGFSRFGTATGLISVRLPVIMQAALPRFVRPGDRFAAGGVARVVEGPAGTSRVEIRTSGVQLAPEATATRTIELARGVASNQTFDMVVPTSMRQENVTISLGVERLSDGASDAFEAVLPVRDGVFLEQRATAVRSEPGARTPFPVEAGSFRDGSLHQQLVVALEEDVLRTLSGLRFLDSTERQTTEQRVSGLRAAFRLRSLLADAGWERDLAVGQGPWEEFLSYLDTVRTETGLVAQVPGGRGLVSLTAWILDAMTLATKAGLATPAAVYERTLRPLQEALRSDFAHLIPEYGYQERVEALAALGRAGKFEDTYGQAFLTSALSQDLYAAALLVSIYAEQGQGSQTRVRTAANRLWDATTFRLEGGQRLFTGLSQPARTWGGYLMTSEVRTVAAVIRALAMTDPGDTRIPIMVDYLLRQGDGRGWGTTANTIEALNTLGYLVTRQDRRLLPNLRFTLSFGAVTQTLATANRSIAGYASEAQSPGVVVQAGGGDARPWLYLEARYRPDVLPSQIQARNDGFVVNRELQVITDGRLARRLPVGLAAVELATNALVEEHVTVSNPQTRHYVAVHVPLAAGFEALNPELDTSGADAVPTGRPTVPPTYTRFLDDGVTYYYESLPAGTYHFYFRERAMFAGTYQLPPAWAEAIYDPGAWGNSAGGSVRIR
jgi:hypothetical protein